VEKRKKMFFVEIYVYAVVEKCDIKSNIEVFDPEESNYVIVIKILKLNYERIKLN
jgi:hypothetical protein